jgi:hypothetical protein
MQPAQHTRYCKKSLLGVLSEMSPINLTNYPSVKITLDLRKDEQRFKEIQYIVH